MHCDGYWIVESAIADPEQFRHLVATAPTSCIWRGAECHPALTEIRRAGLGPVVSEGARKTDLTVQGVSPRL